MNKYLIQGADYNTTKTIYQQNFNDVEHLAAIAGCEAGTVLATDDEQIIDVFRNSEGLIVTNLYKNVFNLMLINGELKGIIGHELCVEELTNADI